MKQIKTIATMLTLIAGLAMLIASWYVVVAVVVLFVTYHAAKGYQTVKEIIDEP